jgi:neutral ceramidase
VIIGLGKNEITPKLTNTSMLGYGNMSQIARSVNDPLYARTCLIQSEENQFIFINLEVCFITEVLRKSILETLLKTTEFKEIKAHELIITAQHTHSAPGGFDEYPMYNMAIPGFVETTLTSYVEGAVKSALTAFNSKTNSELLYGTDYFSPSLPVAFNRSLIAYLENPEVQLNNMPKDKHLALDRAMKLLAIKQNGKVVGCLNWFGVHATCLPNDNSAISSDNKGVAASSLEGKNENNFIALFNQGNAGDVSPNWIWDEKLKRSRGVAQDPFQNAQTNGKLQATKAQEIIDKNEDLTIISSKIDAVLVYEDMSNINIDAEFLPNNVFTGKTSSACMGVSFLEGTKEGPGISTPISFILKLCSTLVKTKDIIYSLMLPLGEKEKIWEFYRSQGNKNIFINSHTRKILGIKNLLLLPIPELINPVIKVVKSYYKVGALNENTWLQEILPVQLNRIGQVLICSIPAETTSMAGNRIEKQLLEEFKGEGIDQIILSPYSNGYCGYITTPEEYEVQLYEGGHTLFGKWTLPAFQTVIKKLSKELKKDIPNRDFSWGKSPVTFSSEELTKRSSHKN